MPLRLGLLVYPMFVLVLALGRAAGTVSKFVEAGAMSPATARKPSSIDVKHMDHVRKAVKRGALIATGDGRYYVNVPMLERSRRKWRYITVGATALTAAAALLMWHPWT